VKRCCPASRFTGTSGPRKVLVPHGGAGGAERAAWRFRPIHAGGHLIHSSWSHPISGVLCRCLYQQRRLNPPPSSVVVTPSGYCDLSQRPAGVSPQRYESPCRYPAVLRFRQYLEHQRATPSLAAPVIRPPFVLSLGCPRPKQPQGCWVLAVPVKREDRKLVAPGPGGNAGAPRGTGPIDVGGPARSCVALDALQ
jgi:hypothetical protein